MRHQHISPGDSTAHIPARRNWGRLALLAGLLLLAGLINYFGWENLYRRLAGARPVPLAAMALLILTGFWIRAWKWRYALGAGSNGIGLFFLAKMAGNWSPGRVGELAPLLLRSHRNLRVAAWILADRAIEVAFTLWMGLLGLAALGHFPWTGAFALTLATVLGLLFGRARLPQPGSARLDTLPAPQTLRGHAHRWILLIYREIHTLGSHKLPAILLITFIAKLTDVYTVVLLCNAFGYDASFLLVCAARCAHALVSGIPVTPDATGVPYMAAGYFLHQFAGIPAATLIAALALEAGAINLLLWLSSLVGLMGLRRAGPNRI